MGSPLPIPAKVRTGRVPGARALSVVEQWKAVRVQIGIGDTRIFPMMGTPGTFVLSLINIEDGRTHSKTLSNINRSTQMCKDIRHKMQQKS